MARPKLIEELHEAWYDLLFATEGAGESRKHYNKVRDRCCEEYNAPIDELIRAVRKDFAAWIRENDLPKPPSKDP